jgi:hypothetical protein
MTNSTETVTFRLDTNTLEQLRSEAGHKQISLNAMLTHVVKSYMEWSAGARRAGYVPVRKPLIKALLDSLTSEQIDKIGDNYGQDLLEPILMVTGNRPSPESTLEFIERWLRATGFEFHIEVDEQHQLMVYVIQHNIGKNWSLLMARILVRATSQFAENADFEASENTLFLSFNLRKNE